MLTTLDQCEVLMEYQFEPTTKIDNNFFIAGSQNDVLKWILDGQVITVSKLIN